MNEALTLTNLLLSIITVLLVFGLRAIWTVNNAVGEISTTIKGLEKWTEGHEKLDDERFKGLNSWMKRMEDKIVNLAGD